MRGMQIDDRAERLAAALAVMPPGPSRLRFEGVLARLGGRMPGAAAAPDLGHGATGTPSADVDLEAPTDLHVVLQELGAEGTESSTFDEEPPTWFDAVPPEPAGLAAPGSAIADPEEGGRGGVDPGESGASRWDDLDDAEADTVAGAATGSADISAEPAAVPPPDVAAKPRPTPGRAAEPRRGWWRRSG